jgi:L-seryl-tRNA(Ser) seleniumtransferase
MPLAELKSAAISLSPQKISAKRTEARLRDFSPPIICRIEDNRIILDMRCVNDGEIDILAAGLHALANSHSENDPFIQ